jgi:hypothetical protein
MTVRHPHHPGHDEGTDGRPEAGGGEAGALQDDHSASHHRAGDHGLRDHGRTGSRDSVGRPTILSITCAEGERISMIRRADGSTFTVVVPRGGIDRPWAGSRPSRRWIHDDGPPRRVPASALARLAAQVARAGQSSQPALQLLSTEG